MKRGSFNSDKAEFRLILLLKKISVCLLDFSLDRDRAVMNWEATKVAIPSHLFIQREICQHLL